MAQCRPSLVCTARLWRPGPRTSTTLRHGGGGMRPLRGAAQCRPNQETSIHLSLTFADQSPTGCTKVWGVCYDRDMISRDLVLAALTAQSIPAYARLLLAVLILAGDDTDAGRTTISSQRDLARIAGVSPRTVLRATHALERAGLLARTSRYHDDGGCAPSMYTVLTSHLMPLEEPR